MQLFFTIVYIRITTLTWIFHDHPLVEYPLFLKMGKDIKKSIIILYISTFIYPARQWTLKGEI